MFQGKVSQCKDMLGPAGCSRCTELGLLQGTPVRTRLGYRPIESLTFQDELAVFPHGFRRLSSIRQHMAFRDPVSCPTCTLPVLVPAGALGIHGALILQHDMRVLVTDPDLRGVLGTGHVTIRACDLVGFRGIAFAQPQPMCLIVLAFETEEIITIDDGFRVVVPPETLAIAPDPAASFGGTRVYPLSAHQAEDYLAGLDADLARAKG